ncbi:MAG: fibronectin type III domain-containing protein [Gammaproteobacteria bacterium]|nr:fibronectin type III domain-containing protein [Gammaproteobacteria bacterium]MBU1968093.1 fibronectin type III domain-containing protein [Gammaproteobacteria bacterium]
MVLLALCALVFTGCGGGGGTSADAAGGGGGAASCDTTLFSGGVRDATSAELMTYDQTYTGNTGSLDGSFNFIPDAALTLVFGANGSLSYNGAAQTVTSICYETAVPQLVVHYGASGHVDLDTNGDFTGVGPDGTTIIRSGTTPVATVPDAPTGVTATAASTSQVDLGWSAVSGATGYRIYRSTTSGQAVGSMTDVLGGSTQAGTTYSNTGLTASTAYYYKIVAVNATGDSAASTEVSATTDAAGGGGGTPSVWTPHTETGWFFSDMLWDGAQFVGVTNASGGAGVVGTSTDGVSWTLRTMFNGSGIAKSGSTYLVVGVAAATGSDIRTSTDTVNWPNPGVVVGIEKAVGNDSLFVGFSGGSNVGAGQSLDIKSSADGITWTTRHTVTAAANEAVFSFKPVWNGSTFLISGYSWDTTVLPYTFSNFVLTSADGINWTRTNTSDAGRVIWNGTQFVMISSTKKYTSTDGITWSAGTNHNLTDIGSPIIGLDFVDWTGTEYVGFTGGGGTSIKIWTSADAITWTSQTSTPTQAVSCGAGSGSLYVAGGLQFTITSP